MKEFLDILKTYGIEPIINTVGFLTIGLFILSLIPSVSFIPKMVMLFILTH